MCGIAGIMADGSREDVEPPLHRMLAALRHRGPDDSGCESLPAGDGRAVALGTTRLAILDLSPAGHQPMRDPETGNWILLNGEIYNHLEVRRALGDAPWRSRSDTETVLRSYAAWGPACLDRFRGMFAIAVWDHRDRSLWCARDRFGIKPFYYSAADGRFVFASEVGALLASGLVERRISRRGLSGYVRFGSVPEPETLLEGIQSLQPGEWMRIRGEGVTETRTYWRTGSMDRLLGAPAPDAADEVRERLETAVGEHLLSDVPVAAFLSGGLDSSIVTALAARAAARPLRTFTVGFQEPELDESKAARSVAERYATDHHALSLSDTEAASLVPAAVRALDLPSADGVNTFVVARAVAQDGVKVVLSGLGGDELFGGYRSFRLLPLAERWSPVIGAVPARLRRLAARGGSGERAAELTRREATMADRYETLRSFWSEREMAAMGLDAGVGYGDHDPGPGAPAATRVSVLELGGYLRSTLLRDADAMSMAHSLELRVPFLDHELVGTCLRRRAAGPRGLRGHKALLKRAAGDLLPPGLVRGPKRGFVLPMDRWMRGPLRALVADGLEALRESRALPVVDTRPLAARFESRRLPWARLWELSVLGHWLDRHRIRA